MSKRFFGTDGVRGTVGSEPMTADFAMRLASAAAQVQHFVGRVPGDHRTVDVSGGNAVDPNVVPPVVHGH